MDLLQYVRENTPGMNENQVIVALIGASVFNAIASALKLQLSGYYQASGLHIRYVMESGWLLDYLRTTPRMIETWKNTPEDKRQNVFRPGKIREELDKRDGFTEKKRDARYKRLCVLCGHPTFAGFALLRPEPNADAHMGPFFQSGLLRGCFEELVQASIMATQAFMGYFPPQTLTDYRARIYSLEINQDWMAKFFGARLDLEAVHEIKQLTTDLESGYS